MSAGNDHAYLYRGRKCMKNDLEGGEVGFSRGKSWKTLVLSHEPEKPSGGRGWLVL